MNKENITTIAFDADDTLWVNEPFFQDTEAEFCKLFSAFGAEEDIREQLFQTEMQNLELYGYGAKGFMLSMIETANRISEGKISSKEIDAIIELGKQLINKPIELLDEVETVLKNLHKKYQLVLATKGDLLDQERKLAKSGLANYFDHIEVMSDKKEENYQKLIEKLGIRTSGFLMVGNSVKSDVLPVLEIGAQAIHIPFNTTWLHEQMHESADAENFTTLNSISGLIEILN